MYVALLVEKTNLQTNLIGSALHEGRKGDSRYMSCFPLDISARPNIFLVEYCKNARPGAKIRRLAWTPNIHEVRSYM